MFARTPEFRRRLFLDEYNVCDALWNWRDQLARLPRETCAEFALVDLLGPEERAFFSALPPLVTVWRGWGAQARTFLVD